jgi:23S rRNA pseudouridine2605 synthase
MRLNKYLAQNLGISRREADDLIAAGKITLNGKPAALGDRLKEGSVDKNQEVWYNGKIVTASRHVYLALHKPVGYVSSRAKQDQTPTLYELLPEKYQTLKTVGRLDKDSSGLILLTNDGDFAFQMTHPKFQKRKLYEVALDQPLQPLHQQILSDFGVDLPDGKSKLILTSTDPARRRWQVELTEGRNRQIRRSFGALGYTVTQLHRTTFGPYQIQDLKSGAYTEFTPQ